MNGMYDPKKGTKKAVRSLKQRTGIKSFRELGMYDKKKTKKKPTAKTMMRRGIIGFG